MSGGGRGPRVFLKCVRNFLLGNFILTNGGAPGCELFGAETAIASTDKFQSSAFELVEFFFLRKQVARGGAGLWRRKLLKNIKWNSGQPN